ncbi:MAG: hypothetical protein AAF512_12970 [Pseudomonadota bacterium]
MSTLLAAQWWMITGFGAIWLGIQILAAGRLPRLLRGDKAPEAEKGSPQAFMIFWLDQYSWIGLTLTLAGIVFVIAGATS